MAEPTVIQADIPEGLHDAFRALLPTVAQQPNIGALVAHAFMAGVNAERERAAKAGGFIGAYRRARAYGVALPVEPIDTFQASVEMDEQIRRDAAGVTVLDRHTECSAPTHEGFSGIRGDETK